MGALPVGPIPPLGPLLDPVHGVWSSAGADFRTGSQHVIASITGLHGNVDVQYDVRGVPHIFALDEDDAYRALGYVVARDRLFQLDIQTRAASGRLTELVGPSVLALDEEPRRLGMPRAAQQKLAALPSGSISRKLIDAYTDGVNSYVDALKPADYPIEYKLLNARPERWHPINSLHLLNRMGWTLASADPEHTFIRVSALVGTKAAAALFPDHTPIEEPIQPVPGWAAPHTAFEQLPPAGAPDSTAMVRHSRAGGNRSQRRNDVPSTRHSQRRNDVPSTRHSQRRNDVPSSRHSRVSGNPCSDGGTMDSRFRGNDDRYGFRGNDDRYGFRGNDDRYGFRGNDDRYGPRGNDDSYGPRGNDDSYGPRGNDDRYGFRGNDDSYGPRGNDDAGDAAECSAGDANDTRGFASNNWAVAPRRTRAGYALLAGDPHLNLTLPSIWYEVQMTVPGKLDVYGVTIPGAPGVIIGFNRDLAWSFTNVGADVMDFYRETVDDSTHPKHYMLDGNWHDLVSNVETYRDQHGRVIHVDTLLYTHRGPLLHERGQWLSMRWTVLEPSDELRAFYDVAHSASARDFENAMARSFFVPAQNMLVADRSGSIAIRSTGHYPLRPDNGSGRVIRDGSTSASDWRGFWPVARYPQSLNSAQGFVASANQEPEIPPAEYAYLATDPNYEVWRALRINQLLRADSSVTPDDMRRWQTDPGSARADMFVPYFVAVAEIQSARGRGNPTLDTAAALLSQWDRRYTRDNQRAVLFEAAMDQLKARTWDELATNGKRVATPTDAVMAELLTQPKSAWWDDHRTPGITEDRDDILAASLTSAYGEVVRRYGPPDAGGWRWDRIRFANIYHLLRIPAFSALHIPVQGGRGTLAPSHGDGESGPSWRMVVQLGPDVHGWGTLPGGESGNPYSPHYTDQLQFWKRGELQPLIFPRSRNALAAASVSAELILVPGKR